MLGSRLTQEKLQIGCTRGEIKIYTADIIREIDAKIETANKNGQSSIIYNLPDCIIHTKLKPEDVRIIVYAEIIRAFQNSGFEVKMKKVELVHILLISWKNGLTDEERKEYLAIIHSSYVN